MKSNANKQELTTDRKQVEFIKNKAKGRGAVSIAWGEKSDLKRETNSLESLFRPVLTASSAESISPTSIKAFASLQSRTTIHGNLEMDMEKCEKTLEEKIELEHICT